MDTTSDTHGRTQNIKIYSSCSPSFFGIILNIGDFLSNQSQKRKQEETTRDLKGQIITLVNASRIQATIDDVKKIGTDLQIGMQAGFDRVVAAINEKQIPTTPIPPPPSAVPTIENTRLVQKSTISDKAEFPYGLQVIIQSNIVIQPVAFALECDGEIGDFSFFIAGQTAYMSVRKSIRGNIAEIRFSFPPLTPESPLVVTIQSKSKIQVIKAYKLNP